MYAHRYHSWKKKKRKWTAIRLLLGLAVLYLCIGIKEQSGLWEYIGMRGKIAGYQELLELYLPGVVSVVSEETKDSYTPEVESALSYEDILAREAVDENYVDENGNFVEAGTLKGDLSENTGTSQAETSWQEAAPVEADGTPEQDTASQAGGTSEQNTASETAAPETTAQNVAEVQAFEPIYSRIVTGEQKNQYVKEKLNDFDYLVQNFYQIDNTTTITGSQLNVEQLLGKDCRLSHDATTPQILIYHTHSQEGYADSIPGDENTTVVGVGDYLTKLLTERYGLSVIHHRGQYDVDDRDHAYSKAGPALEQLLSENPQVEVVIDLHRDGVREDTHLATEVNGVKMAQIMFFNGLSRTTKLGDIDYLYNPYIEDNLAISFQMQLKAAEYYPGLTRRIYLKGYRYNMHYCPKSLLIEVGAQTNTLEEAMNAMIPLSDILYRVLTAAQ